MAPDLEAHRKKVTASFLGHSSYVGAGYQYTDLDDIIEDVYGDTYGVGAEWFVTEGIGLSLNYAHSEIDDTDIESDAVVIAAEMRF